MKPALLGFVACVCFAQGTQINEIEFTGQSLDVGALGTPALSTTQPYSNIQLMRDSGCGYQEYLPVVPLIENTNVSASGCGSGLVETPTAAAANNLTALSPGGSWIWTGTRWGVPGASYSLMAKGSGNYIRWMAAKTGQSVVIHNYAVSQGVSHKIRAISVQHGEADFIGGLAGTTYEADLVQWQGDIQSDAQAITGQTDPIPMFIDQMNSWTAPAEGSSATPTNGGVAGAPLAQWWVARDHPATHFLVGPKYQLPYQSADGVHLTNIGYRWLGAMIAKAMAVYFYSGRPWVPLAPRSITISGASVTVRLWVPVGTLVIDTTTLSDQGNCKGFEFVDDSGHTFTCPSAVTVAGDTVTIPLDEVPAGSLASQRVRYAYTGTPGAISGAGRPHGNIRDSDPAVSLAGDSLADWLITFDEPVNFSWNPYPSGPVHVSMIHVLIH